MSRLPTILLSREFSWGLLAELGDAGANYAGAGEDFKAVGAFEDMIGLTFNFASGFAQDRDGFFAVVIGKFVAELIGADGYEMEDGGA